MFIVLGSNLDLRIFTPLALYIQYAAFTIRALLGQTHLPEIYQMTTATPSQSSKKNPIVDQGSYTLCKFNESTEAPLVQCTINEANLDLDSEFLHATRPATSTLKKVRNESNIALLCRHFVNDSLRLLSAGTCLANELNVSTLETTRRPDLAIFDSLPPYACRVFIEVKFPGKNVFTSAKIAGQIWRYLRQLQQLGVQTPMVLLMTYCDAALCWLKEHDATVKKILSDKTRAQRFPRPKTPTTRQDKTATSNPPSPERMGVPDYAECTPPTNEWNTISSRPDAIATDNESKVGVAELPEYKSVTGRAAASTAASSSHIGELGAASTTESTPKVTQEQTEKSSDEYVVVRTAVYHFANIKGGTASYESQDEDGRKRKPTPDATESTGGISKRVCCEQTRRNCASYLTWHE